jgi:acetyl esterase/lipase
MNLQKKPLNTFNMGSRMISLAMIVLCSCSWLTSTAQVNDPLRFPADQFTLETKTVMTAMGKKKVTYRSYMHLLYVANPVDKDYQSLNISVPVMVDDVTVDATNAPILFHIGVGGYMSSRNVFDSGSERDRGGPQNLIPDLALAAGYVVISPGCRGRDNRAADGSYYGKAPAAIVDLKAAVRYIRYNDNVIPGNADWIVSTGCSAGGALSALLGTSGNSRLYDKSLSEIGAADAADHIYASACFSPITDLEHSDMAYEWMYGTIPTRNGLVDQELSRQLKASFVEYQASLDLQGDHGFGTINADNYASYLMEYYLVPSANKYLGELTDEDRAEYLAENPWIEWTNEKARFTFADYLMHVGRMKGLPAFDDFEKRQPEPVLFGDRATDARHFTNFSLRQSTGNQHAEIDKELKMTVNMMNAMYFIGQNNNGCAGYWWIRNGTRDNHTSLTVCINLALGLENRDKAVNEWLFWDGGHCANDDPEGLISWISDITGF